MRKFLLVLLITIIAFFACWAFVFQPKTHKNNSSTLANPASVNCVKKGGTISIVNGPNGEYGICMFEDDRQCEEWALYRGECPVGGVKITGYLTDEARYCAIIGGIYTEQTNLCTRGENQCDATALYQGNCSL